jgi:hypothetical protein
LYVKQADCKLDKKNEKRSSTAASHYLNSIFPTRCQQIIRRHQQAMSNTSNDVQGNLHDWNFNLLHVEQEMAGEFVSIFWTMMF